jgi:hypothetical protein
VVDIGAGDFCSIIALIELGMLKEALVIEPSLERWYKPLKKMGYTKEYFQTNNVIILKRKFSNSLLKMVDFTPTLMIKTFNNWVLWDDVNIPPNNCTFISNESHDEFLRAAQEPNHSFQSGITIYKR